MDLNKKAIYFDLRTKDLKKYYPSKHYRKAYRDIKHFLLKNGFIHRQWSGYVSKQPMYDTDIDELTIKLSITFPWLKQCVRRFDVTNIGRSYDYLPTIFNADTLWAKIEKASGKNKPKPKSTAVKAIKNEVRPMSSNTVIEDSNSDEDQDIILYDLFQSRGR